MKFGADDREYPAFVVAGGGPDHPTTPYHVKAWWIDGQGRRVTCILADFDYEGRDSLRDAIACAKGLALEYGWAYWERPSSHGPGFVPLASSAPPCETGPVEACSPERSAPVIGGEGGDDFTRKCSTCGRRVPMGQGYVCSHQADEEQ